MRCTYRRVVNTGSGPVPVLIRKYALVRGIHLIESKYGDFVYTKTASCLTSLLSHIIMLHTCTNYRIIRGAQFLWFSWCRSHENFTSRNFKVSIIL